MTLALGLATPSLRGHLQRDVPPSWVGHGASFDVDFINRRAFRSNRRTVQERFDQDSLADILTLTRASAATRFQADGDLAEMAADAFRFDHDPVTLEPLGHLFEDTRTNSIRNPRGEGAVVGTPGTPPTYMSQTGASLSSEITAVGSEDGIDYFKVRIYGTPSISSSSFLFEANTQIAAAVGQTWALSGCIRRDGGSTANISSIQFDCLQRNSGGASVGNNVAVTLSIPASGALRTCRLGGVATLAQATTAYVQPRLLFFHPALAPIDITLCIGIPQLELVNAAAPFPSSPILPPVSSPAASTRAADLMTIAAGSCLNPAEGTLLVILRSPYAATSTFDMRAVSISDGSTSNTVSLRARASTGQLYAVVLTSGATAFAALQGTFAANQRFKHAVAYKQNDFIAALDGTLSSADASGSVPSGLNIFHVGSFVGNAKYFGHIERVSYFPFRMTNAKLAALTA